MPVTPTANAVVGSPPETLASTNGLQGSLPEGSSGQAQGRVLLNLAEGSYALTEMFACRYRTYASCCST